MATRTFPWKTGGSFAVTDSTARSNAATAETDAQLVIAVCALVSVEGKKKVLRFRFSAVDLTDDGTVVIGTLPIGIASVVGGSLRVLTAGVGARTATVDIKKADGTTTILTAPATIASGNTAAADTVSTIGAGAVACTVQLLKAVFDYAAGGITSGAIYELLLEVSV